MKKTMIAIMILSLAMVFVACAEDDSCDKDAVVERIESLEDAINSNDFESFLANVGTDTNQFDSFNQSSLDSLTDNGTTTYDFNSCDISCDGEDAADASCTATITPGGDEPTLFTLEKNSEWYIITWEEGDPAVVMYDKHTTGK